ncbi:MAG: C1 family peptidase [Sphingomonadaceae bacterium]|nr:C1 family peptidase [Sphingomonadaceae bacterium]
MGLPPPGEPTDLTLSPPSGAPEIDVRCPNWPVRDQNPRGTCVSFGAVACLECAEGHESASELSEQFLYWAIKTGTGDPIPSEDGTWLEFARDALASHGVCLEDEWPYINSEVQPVSGQTTAEPTAAARASASGRRLHAGIYYRDPSSTAHLVRDALSDQGRPVAISLPVFQDPLTSRGPTNWTTAVGWLYGTVLNPPPTSVVVGGHCVCITGFVADPAESAGGYFIIRNSWGTDWGRDNPNPTGGPAPEAGYGAVSATYVDKYCWEVFQA